VTDEQQPLLRTQVSMTTAQSLTGQIILAISDPGAFATRRRWAGIWPVELAAAAAPTSVR
jgi:hypothetical protein